MGPARSKKTVSSGLALVICPMNVLSKQTPRRCRYISHSSVCRSMERQAARNLIRALSNSCERRSLGTGSAGLDHYDDFFSFMVTWTVCNVYMVTCTVIFL